jgi:putative DNA primase/helicase
MNAKEANAQAQIAMKAALKQKQWALTSQGAARIDAMLKLASHAESVQIEFGELNKNPWLFNCPNGTLDLQSGKLREHRREDYITQLSPTEYHPEATCPAFERFLGAIFPNDEDEPDVELITFVQRLLGRCLSGDVSEQILPIFWGGGGNGKGVLVNAMQSVIGNDYYLKAINNMLVHARGERHLAETAILFGKRLVVASETAEGSSLNETLVKDLTGGELITARRMRENPWSFFPAHKIFLLTNYKPKISGFDEGIWRRLRLIPFEVEFWDELDPAKVAACLPSSRKQDKQLGAKLEREREGILAWLLRGCMDWQRDGLTMPAKVRAATNEYRDDEDVIARWTSDCCKVCLGDNDYRERASKLYGSYVAWCETAGEKALSQKSFAAQLEKSGFPKKKGMDANWYCGIVLLSATAASA